MPTLPPVTAAQLLAQADEIERRAQEEAQSLRQRAILIEQDAAEKAEALRKAAEAFEDVANSWDLPSGADDDTLDTMDATANATAPPRGPRFTSGHPLVIRAKKLKRSMPAVAAELTKALGWTISRTVVRSWYAPAGDVAARPIPEKAVKYLQQPPWRIPRSAWRDIREE
jgi:hypothetical protein